VQLYFLLYLCNTADNKISTVQFRRKCNRALEVTWSHCELLAMCSFAAFIQGHAHQGIFYSNWFNSDRDRAIMWHAIFLRHSVQECTSYI